MRTAFRNAKALIASLRRATKLGIVCPHCDRRISAQRAVLFTQDEKDQVPEAVQFQEDQLAQLEEIRAEVESARSKPERVATTTRAVNIGQIVEEFAPVLPGFGFEPADCRGVFAPVDYIVFHGAARLKVEQIEIVEVKSGNARLSNVQRDVRDCVEKGRVRFNVLKGPPMKITDVGMYDAFRHVFCACRCGGVFRLSDTQIVDLRRYTPKDWMTKLDRSLARAENALERAQQAYDDAAEKIRLRERRAAERLTHAAVGKVLPALTDLGIEAADVKALFSPVSFVAFEGLRDRAIDKITFLDAVPRTSRHERLQQTIARCIREGSVSWATVRVGADGSVKRE